MKRYLICPVIGTGTFADSFRASVQDVPNVNASALIPTHTSGPNIGHPRFNFALCVASGESQAVLSSPANSYVFPDYPLDARMDGMESNARTGLVQSVQAYDLDGNGLHFDASHQDGESYRDLLTRLLQTIEPAASLNTFDVSEVPAQ